MFKMYLFIGMVILPGSLAKAAEPCTEREAEAFGAAVAVYVKSLGGVASLASRSAMVVFGGLVAGAGFEVSLHYDEMCDSFADGTERWQETELQVSEAKRASIRAVVDSISDSIDGYAQAALDAGGALYLYPFATVYLPTPVTTIVECHESDPFCGGELGGGYGP